MSKGREELSHQSPDFLPPRLKAAEWLVLCGLLVFCLLVALTQEVNPFPEDGWFFSQFRLFEHNPGADNYTPIAAPAYLYFSIHALAKILGYNLQTEFYLASLIQNFMVFLAGLCVFMAHRMLGLGRFGLLLTVAFVVFVESTLVSQAFWSELLTPQQLQPLCRTTNLESLWERRPPTRLLRAEPSIHSSC